MSGFKKFLMRGNLIELAVAVVIGVAFNAIVQALVADMVTPLITAIAGTPTSFAKLRFPAHGSLNGAQFTYGAVANAILSFVVIAAVVYFLIVAPAARLTALADRKKAATTRDCPDCLSQIPVAARKCMYCTSEVPPHQAAGTDVPAPRRARHGYLASE
jgi:large conductance mechanosensitive channel